MVRKQWSAVLDAPAPHASTRRKPADAAVPADRVRQEGEAHDWRRWAASLDGTAEVAKVGPAFHQLGMSATVRRTRRSGTVPPMIWNIPLMDSMPLGLGTVCFSNLRLAALPGPMVVTHGVTHDRAWHTQEQQ